MKIKFRISDGEVIEYQKFKDDYEFFAVGQNEIYSADYDETYIEYYHRGHLVYENGTVRKMTQGEIDAYEAQKIANEVKPYNDKACKAELARTFGISFSMAPFYPALSDYLTYQNWEELNEFYIPGLITAEFVTLEQKTLFASIVNKWGGSIVV